MHPFAGMNTPSFPIATDSLSSSGATDTPGRGATAAAPRSGWLGSALGLLAFAGASLVVAAVGARVTARNKSWYRLLRKSPLTPPDRTFAVVWPVLYGLGALSAWRIARTGESPARTRALALWGTQLACNAAWTHLFFGAHRPAAALTDLALNGAFLAAYAVEARKLDPIAAAMVLPNLGWLAFAGTLNAAAVERNAGPMRLLVRR
jgi:tryptophan-rich sensory protein